MVMVSSQRQKPHFRSRKSLLGSLVAVILFALLSFAVTTTLAGAGDDPDVALHGSETILKAQGDSPREMCVAEQQALGRDAVPVFDFGTADTAVLSVDQYCTEYAALSVPMKVLEQANVYPTFRVVSGHVRATYQSARLNSESRLEPFGDPIPDEDALQRIAAAAAGSTGSGEK
jgi:hypothetical protein